GVRLHWRAADRGRARQFAAQKAGAGPPFAENRFDPRRRLQAGAAPAGPAVSAGRGLRRPLDMVGGGCRKVPDGVPECVPATGCRKRAPAGHEAGGRPATGNRDARKIVVYWWAESIAKG